MKIKSNGQMIVKGRLTQTGASFHIDRHNNRAAVFKCSCGNVKVIRVFDINSGKIASCGCHSRQQCSIRSSTHRKTSTPEYVAWRNMLQRVNGTAGVQAKKDYCDRGITVCERWRKFENFLSDVGLRPGPGFSIDRKDNSGNYEPSNVWWTTRKKQNRNTRRNRLLTCFGETKTVSDWAEDIGMKPLTLLMRINLGWSVEDAITKPLRKSTRIY